MSVNRELVELLGMCCHESGEYVDICHKCGHAFNHIQPTPDFVSDARLVLREMVKYCGDDEYKFAQFLYSLPVHGTYPHLLRSFILDLILDQTGKLAELAVEFLKGRGK